MSILERLEGNRFPIKSVIFFGILFGLSIGGFIVTG